ncbi:MAG: hypothetical protein A2653_00465 [Candidatus Zambryskibacteria bacterium RIFCSPHIGHO2_01_FULL_43_25]|uniref:SIMPL domain-containing protein n=1 Tax=Candidatus Zambryskibacteria bacterium RIFCSPLOWO2_01_FULL_45_21 TaxID=1802761 RepID=A0A1G2U1E2_9BACT|nr:MAG: hypothetical protein A2653_00465 [Candidatus Zambryskibacteria bacterium RIFCSPHIGHO2_01_FULL_43_25]OHB00884.1 MAG: hypothetical protein A3E94_01360 [Candidatus Zambryskibacteria bacterium RIFCSPHIGHO2_12_FULL_44_12b]OHB03338.1 MAG: hypothetical protein A3B14_00300 [Candidatus Zambryskibacteria bacterium RIFCSPLOWO2_01_FULL_45_21]
MNETTNEKDKFLKVGQLALLLLSLFLLIQAISSVKEYGYIGGTDVPSNVISVSGEGEVFAVPDIATISFSVVETAEDVGLAQELANKKMDDVVKKLKDLGIEEKDIKTEGYNAYPKYQYDEIVCITYPCPRGEQKIVGYEVSHYVTVKIRKVDEAGDILSAIGSLKVSNISGISFAIDDETALAREARQKAIEDAKTKAKDLAKDLDVKLVRIISFNENGSYPPIMFKAGLAMGMGGDAESVSSVPVQAGENRIVSNVTITYEIK